MFDLTAFKGVRLRGGFRIISLEFADEPMVDAASREAIARTAIVGPQIEITIRSGLDERELSVSLYHEILEAATIGSNDPTRKRSRAWRSGFREDCLCDA